MSARARLRNILVWSALGLLGAGCKTTPSVPMGPDDETGDEQALRSEFMTHCGRIEAKTGIVLPVNDRFDISDPSDGVVGVKGSFEAVEKGMFFGLEFDYTGIDVKDPITPATLGAQNLLNLHTEQLLDHFKRFEFLATWDYDIVLPLTGTKYDPILRPGIGLGLVLIDPEEALGNTLVTFDNLYQFVGRPTLALRFPFTENFGAFIEANYDFVPQSNLQGQVAPSRKTQDIGDKIEFGTGNLWFGISAEF